jgi:trigger factor
MLNLISSQFITSEEFTAKFTVAKVDYQKIEKEVLAKYLEGLEIQGFRKGKAPIAKAMEKVDPSQLQEMVYNQVLSINYAQSTQLAAAEFNKDGERVVLNVNLVNAPDSVGIDDDGFFYSLMFNLAPNIDLNFVKKVVVGKVHVENTPGFISLDDFSSKQEQFYLSAFGEYEESSKAITPKDRVVADLVETNVTINDVNSTNDNTIQLGMNYYPVEFESQVVGMKAGELKTFEMETKDKTGKKISLKIDITIKKVLELSSTKLEDLINSNENIKPTFPTIEAFNDSVKSDYEKDKSANENKFQTRAAFEAIVKACPKIDVDEVVLQKEIERIDSELAVNEADPVEAFNNLGFLFTSRATKTTLKSEIENYVRGEFTLEKILFATYLTKVETKITSEEIESNYKTVSENPSAYSFPATAKGEELKNQIFDRILRNKAQNWLLENITIK